MDLGSQQVLNEEEEEDLESNEELDEFFDGIFPQARKSDVDSEEELDSFFVDQDDAEPQQDAAASSFSINAPMLNDEEEGGDISGVVSQQFVEGPDMPETQFLFSPNHQMRHDYSVPTSPFAQGTYITPQKVKNVDQEQNSFPEASEDEQACQDVKNIGDQAPTAPTADDELSSRSNQPSRKRSIRRVSLNLVIPKVSLSVAPVRQIPVETRESDSVDRPLDDFSQAVKEDYLVDNPIAASNSVHFNPQAVVSEHQKENIDSISLEQLVATGSPSKFDVSVLVRLNMSQPSF